MVWHGYSGTRHSRQSPPYVAPDTYNTMTVRQRTPLAWQQVLPGRISQLTFVVLGFLFSLLYDVTPAQPFFAASSCRSIPRCFRASRFCFSVSGGTFCLPLPLAPAAALDCGCGSTGPDAAAAAALERSAAAAAVGCLAAVAAGSSGRFRLGLAAATAPFASESAQD